jgi:SPP1 family predicted phage head-tail adaptor
MMAGKLRHKVTVQIVTETQDAYGEADKSWSTHKIVWADVAPISGREFFNAKQFASEISHKITIRHDSTITPKMRILYDSRYFNIESVINEGERDRQTTLMCKEIV